MNSRYGEEREDGKSLVQKKRKWTKKAEKQRKQQSKIVIGSGVDFTAVEPKTQVILCRHKHRFYLPLRRASLIGSLALMVLYFECG
jgi:hypothetical protein